MPPQWAGYAASTAEKGEPMAEHPMADRLITQSQTMDSRSNCPVCGHELVIRWGRYGKFISCSNFPICRHTEAWLEKIGVNCPKCNGEIVQRKTRKGRVFYGCSNYPECDFTSWKQPILSPCPKCSGLLVVVNKREVQCLNCQETFLMDQIGETTAETA